MPIYEYRCTSCSAEFEYMQRISEAPRTECEKCGGALERLISRSAFHLKGGGWYKDLYSSTKPKSSGDSAGTSSESSGGSESKSTPASESKSSGGSGD